MSKAIILTGSAKESNKLRDQYWMGASVLFVPVCTIHRGGLHGSTGDVYYTDEALTVLTDAAARTVIPTAVSAAEYDAADRTWRAWRTAARYARSIRPFEAWLHLNETPLEELAERHIEDSAVIQSQRIVTLAEAESHLFDVVGHYRHIVAQEVRDYADRRLIRIAPRRLVITETPSTMGSPWVAGDPAPSILIRAIWAAIPAGERSIPDWILGHGLDQTSSSTVQ